MSRELNYLEQCNTVAKNSKCLSRKIGTLLVKDNTVIGTGYNGPPRGVPHCNERYILDPELQTALKDKNIDPLDESIHQTCPRYTLGFSSGEALEWCVAGHSERNALINSARLGIETMGCTLYMNCAVPCTPCLVEIINAGIKEIVVTQMKYYDVSAKYLVENSDLQVRVYSKVFRIEVGKKDPTKVIEALKERFRKK